MTCYRSGRRQYGFTLVELLVVISILGVLAGVVVYSVSGVGDRGQVAACDEDARTIKVAEESYKASKATYATEAELVAAGWLSTPSSLHDITNNGSSYTIVDLTTCANATSTTVAANLPAGISIRTGGPKGVTVELISSNKDGLQGGNVDYATSAWTNMGYTGTDGTITATLADGKYSFRMDFRGQTTDTGLLTVTSGTVVTFRTAPIIVVLTGGGSSLTPAEVAYRGNNGFWVTADATDPSGVSTAELLLGSYEPRVDFNGQTNVLASETLTTATKIGVPLTTTTIQTSHGGAIQHRGNNGPAWITDGDAGTDTVTVALLAGVYDFQAPYKSAHSSMGVSVSGPTQAVTIP